MAADRLTQIEIAYHAARNRRAEDRSRFLDEVCGADIVMRRQIEALLGQDSSANSLLDRPAIEAVVESTSAGTEPDLSGIHIGVYEVLEPIGSGGMGVVYRAHDTVLHRHVALKTLLPPLVADLEGRARFRREAQVLASLNHPNIAAIYGFEEIDGVPALVMELVDGLTLADRIANGPIPLNEALPIARQVVEALETAHERGIVHRDLKPANIKVRPDGTVKILDFGLAKALGPAVSVAGEPDGSPPMKAYASSGSGMLLGTAAYMSPEQVKGGDVDKRSDVWAFGCVLYEMVTGKRAFGGEDVVATLSAVLRDTPDWSVWPDAVPPQLRALVEGCLEKDRKQRIAKISTAGLMNERRTADRLYQQGRQLWQQGTQESARKAIEYFEAAIRHDPGCALAYSGIADAYLFGSGTGSPAREARQRGRQAATTALKLDPLLGEAHSSFAGILWSDDWDFAGAEREFKRAIELSPSYLEAHHQYSHLLLAVGRVDESRAESEKLLELEPVSTLSIGHLGYHHLYARQYDDAIRSIKGAISAEPNSPVWHRFLGEAYYQIGMVADAAEEYLKFRLLNGATSDEIASERQAFAQRGIGGFFSEVVRHLESGGTLGTWYPLTTLNAVLAGLYARLGERDIAFKWLELAYSERSDALLHLREVLEFDNLRSDTRFATLLKRIGLPPL
jgi:serine/threonine protein kinase